MLHIDMVAFGKCKEAYWLAAAEEYRRRLRVHCVIRLTELQPVALPDAPSSAQVQQALAKEAAMLEDQIAPGTRRVALCVEGQKITSEAFAAWLDISGLESSRIAFVLGSSFGLDEKFKQTAALRLSLSAMTLPHQLARVVLLEQLYRAFLINAGGKYHK